MTKEQAQEVVNEFLKGKVWTSLDFDADHDYDLGQYTVKHDLQDEVEGLGIVYLTFPAKPHYAEALERLNEEWTDENVQALQEITEGDFEDFYDYDKPLKIECETGCYVIVDGKVI